MARFALLLAVLFLLCSPTPAQEFKSDPMLFAMYIRFNEKYFGGKLPTENMTVMWGGPIGKSDRAGTWITHFEGEPEKILTGINPRFENCEACFGLDLLHEMAHIKLRNRNLKDNHGKEFQKEMLRLAKKGAFTKYW